jgi:peptidoglycan hydrolase-like protein with peptidoglycan-binding domain
MSCLSHDDVPAPSSAATEPGRDAERTLAFRRSLRASRTRRAAAALRRRRLLRGRGSALVAAFGLLAAAGGAIAQQQAAGGLSTDTIAAAQRALGVAADGIVGPRTRSATKAFQRKNDLEADGVIGPLTLKALGIDIGTPAAPGAGPLLARIAACESGGDPRAVSADGRYRGKYQFLAETWRGVGGSGDPAAAPESEQDRRAALLLQRAGPSAWPVCA